MAAIKLEQSENKSVLDTAKELGISRAVCAVGSTNTMNTEKVQFSHGNALFNSTYEIKKLQKKNEELRVENELLKTPGLLEEKECVRFQFLKENQKKYNIKKACRILKISRSGFYDFLHRRKSKKSIENEALAEMISDIFKENEGRYGSRRIQKVLLQRVAHIYVTALSGIAPALWLPAEHE